MNNSRNTIHIQFCSDLNKIKHLDYDSVFSSLFINCTCFTISRLLALKHSTEKTIRERSWKVGKIQYFNSTHASFSRLIFLISHHVEFALHEKMTLCHPWRTKKKHTEEAWISFAWLGRVWESFEQRYWLSRLSRRHCRSAGALAGF